MLCQLLLTMDTIHPTCMKVKAFLHKISLRLWDSVKMMEITREIQRNCSTMHEITGV